MRYLLVAPLTGMSSHPSPSPTSHRIGISYLHGRFLVVAAEFIGAEEVIFTVAGERVTEPSRYSLQVGESEHLDVPPGSSLHEQLASYPWRFLNHSCDPNAAFRGGELIALRPVRPWDEVTFDYTTTEFAMAEPFFCVCGSPGCLGEVRGFRYLDAEQQRRRLPHTAAHVLAAARRGSLTAGA